MESAGYKSGRINAHTCDCVYLHVRVKLKTCVCLPLFVFMTVYVCMVCLYQTIIEIHM
jgi:hypothetical protein